MSLNYSLLFRLEDELFIPIPLTGNIGLSPLFNSEDSVYSYLFENGDNSVISVDCPNREGKCILLSIHYLAVRVLALM